MSRRNFVKIPFLSGHIGDQQVEEIFLNNTRIAIMASPEVERPITSPSNPVLSPHGLSPGNAGPAATRPSPGSSTSRKVVTFDHGLSASVDVDRKSIPPSSHYHSAKHKFNFS